MTRGELRLRSALSRVGVIGQQANDVVRAVKGTELLVTGGEVREVAQAEHVDDHCHTSAYAVFTKTA